MRTRYIPIDDNDVGFVQDQHASFDLDCASPLTEQYSTWTHYSDSEPTSLRSFLNAAW